MPIIKKYITLYIDLSLIQISFYLKNGQEKCSILQFHNIKVTRPFS